jgi:MFS family permease
MIYLTSQWFPQRNRASIMGLFYMGAPLALTLGSPLSGALLEMHGFMGHPGWFWMFLIEGWLPPPVSLPSSGWTIRQRRHGSSRRKRRAFLRLNLPAKRRVK